MLKMHKWPEGCQIAERKTLDFEQPKKLAYFLYLLNDVFILVATTGKGTIRNQKRVIKGTFAFQRRILDY